MGLHVCWHQVTRRPPVVAQNIYLSGPHIPTSPCMRPVPHALLTRRTVGGRAAVREREGEEAAAQAARAEGQEAAQALEGRARESSQAGQELRAEVEELREQLAADEQAAQVGLQAPFARRFRTPWQWGGVRPGKLACASRD